MSGVFSLQRNIRLRLLRLPYDIETMKRKTIKDAFSTFYILKKRGPLTNHSAQGAIYIATLPKIIFLTQKKNQQP